MSVIFPHGHGSATAEHILVGTARSCHPDGADKRDAVDNRHGSTDGHDAPTVRNDETAQPGLACLRHEHCCREVKGGGGVRFVKRQLGGLELSFIHTPNGDRRAGFIYDDSCDRIAKPLRVLVRGLNHRPRYIKRHRSNGRFVLAEESGVDVDRRLMFGGHVDILEDRVHGHTISHCSQSMQTSGSM